MKSLILQSAMELLKETGSQYEARLWINTQTNEIIQPGNQEHGEVIAADMKKFGVDDTDTAKAMIKLQKRLKDDPSDMDAAGSIRVRLQDLNRVAIGKGIWVRGLYIKQFGELNLHAKNASVARKACKVLDESDTVKAGGLRRLHIDTDTNSMTIEGPVQIGRFIDGHGSAGSKSKLAQFRESDTTE